MSPRRSLLTHRRFVVAGWIIAGASGAFLSGCQSGDDASRNTGAVAAASLSNADIGGSPAVKAKPALQPKPDPLTKPDESASLKATGKGGLAMDDAVARAVAFSPDVKSRLALVADQEQQIEAARAGYYPTLSAGVNSGIGSSTDGAFNPSAQVSGSQVIYDFGKVSSTIASASAGKDVRTAQVLVRTDDVIKETAEAFIEVQRNQALTTAAQAQVAGLESIGELVKQRVDMGGSSKADEVQTEARIQAARSTVMMYEAQLGRWQATVGFLIGAPTATARISSSAPAWIYKACESSELDPEIAPRVQAATAQYNQATAETKLSRARLYPSIVLEGQVGYDLVSHNDSRPVNYDVGIAAQGSLFDGGAARAKQRAAAYREAAAKTAIDVARYETSRDLVEARGETKSLKQLQTTFAARRKLASETRDLYQKQYLDLGTKTLLDLLNAELETHAIEFDAANTEHDLRKLGISCIYGAGQAQKAFNVAPPQMAAGAPASKGALQ